MFKLSDKTLNFIYSIGAAVVIFGALFKITHWQLPFGISGNAILGLGLVVEGFIFILYAFNPPVSEEKYAWENVYPELLDSKAEATPKKVVTQIEQVKDLEVSLSSKLDEMLASAKIDSGLFERLKSGIEKFSSSVDQINSAVDISSASAKYNDQLTKAANHLESLNALYSLQMDNNRNQSELNHIYVENLQKSAQQSEKFNQELNGLTANLNNLNKVYGGMLNAMKG